MIRRRGRDPWWGDEGVRAKRTRRRVQAESLLAVGLAITACGLVGALWLRILAPLAPATRSGLTRRPGAAAFLPHRLRCWS